MGAVATGGHMEGKGVAEQGGEAQGGEGEAGMRGEGWEKGEQGAEQEGRGGEKGQVKKWGQAGGGTRGAYAKARGEKGRRDWRGEGASRGGEGIGGEVAIYCSSQPCLEISPAPQLWRPPFFLKRPKSLPWRLHLLLPRTPRCTHFLSHTLVLSFLLGTTPFASTSSTPGEGERRGRDEEWGMDAAGRPSVSWCF
ncbi:unnamed protein product [Closterium sp. Naga37s-1]|nr:unnamed protein product [Closterium sp. Naga37s-1]